MLRDFIFKVNMKTITKRLKPIVSQIVSPQPAGFVLERSVFECIGLVSEGA